MEYFLHFPIQTVKKSSVQGFTLVELLIVITMLGILFISLIVILNPLAQINKSQNATRQHDLDEIKTALDTYFNDNGCYPSTLSFGTKWSVGAGVYLTSVPEDPKCSADGANCYVYQTDTSSNCPQWDVLYAKLATPISQSVGCSLQSSCQPSNMAALGLNYCVVSGKVDCSISSSQVTPVPPASNPTPTPRGQAPTPTTGACSTYYACTGQGANGCNILSQNSSQNCTQLGGAMVCYCDSACSGQCQ